MENSVLCISVAFALVIRLTIAIRIWSLEASLNSSVYKAYKKATRQIETSIRDWLFRTGKTCHLWGEVVVYKQEIPDQKEVEMKDELSRTLTCTLCAYFISQSLFGVMQNERISAVWSK